MAYDGITLNSIVQELQSLVGGKVDTIFEPTNENVLLGIYKNKHYALDIDISANNYRLNLTSTNKPNPMVAPNFCMVLRKNLMNYRVKRIYQVGLERICYIEFEGLNILDNPVIKTLAIELMGRYSNIVLLNKEYLIIDALKRFSSIDSARHILPNHYYSLPENPKLNFLDSDKADFIRTIKESKFTVMTDAIPNIYNGISRQFIEHAISKLKLTNTLSDSNLSELYEYINQILEGNFSFVRLSKGYTISNEKTDESFSLNFSIDDFYNQKIVSEQFNSFKNSLLSVINGTLDKFSRKLKNINDKISSCQDMEKYKVYGELLKSSIYLYKDTNFKKDNINKLKLLNYYTNQEEEIPIDPNFNISQNAQKYFKKYSKLKSTLEVTQIQKNDAENELNYLESILYELSDCTTIDGLNTVYEEINENILFSDTSSMNKIKAKRNRYTGKKPQEKELSALNSFIRFKIDDYPVYVGKNNKQNDYLTKRIANERDIWFHAKEIHGSHVILRCNGETPKITTITKCAEIAAYYSKAKYSSHVPVDYTLIKFVKKPNHSQPGYVIYTNNHTIFVDPKSYIEYQSNNV